MHAHKEGILNEIRRTAAANDGEPLGRNKFARLTGIRQGQWYGKYWTCWSEALVEAGFPPNKMKPAFSDEFLLKALAGQLIARLIDYCRGRRGYKDVLKICTQAAEQLDKSAGEAEAKQTQECEQQPEGGCAENQISPGYVYLFKMRRLYKVGRTNSVSRRKRELAGKLPAPLTVVHTIYTDDPPGIEAYWHRRFVNERTEGEWFALRADQVTAFKRRKTM